MRSDDDSAALVVPISAIEHYSYCPRQCALIHVEQVYEENVYTVRGNLTHERVHGGEGGAVRGVEVRRAMSLHSDRLRLVGKADLVEMRPEGPYPVEYKSGRRHYLHAELQLCAQALCLEEMFGCRVPFGAIYNCAARSRREVRIDASLRGQTHGVIAAVRHMLQQQQLPPPTAYRSRCRSCSLLDDCLPDVMRDTARLRGIQSTLFQVYD